MLHRRPWVPSAVESCHYMRLVELRRSKTLPKDQLSETASLSMAEGLPSVIIVSLLGSGAPAAADDDVSTTLLIVGCFALAPNIGSTFAMTVGITFSASELKPTAVAEWLM